MTRILLVEDNEMNLDMLSRRLRRRGYEVVTAGDMRMTFSATVRSTRVSRARNTRANAPLPICSRITRSPSFWPGSMRMGTRRSVSRIPSPAVGPARERWRDHSPF